MAGQKVVQDERPFISVLVPSYYSDKTLPETLDSILAQTFHSWQLIVCDDGTVGFDPAVLELQIQERLPEGCTARIIGHPKNVGTVRNLNAALREATGQWVMLLAADDVLAEARTLEKLSAVAENTAKPWIVSRTELCDEVLHHTGKFSPVDMESLREKTAAVLNEKLCIGCILPSTGNLYRRALLEELGGFDEAYRLVEDWPTFLKLTRAGITPELCTEVSVLHRGGGVSWSSAARNQTYQRDLIETMRQEILPHLEKLSEKDRCSVRHRCEDKAAIYELRFERRGFWPRLKWLFQHGGVIARKMIERT